MRYILIFILTCHIISVNVYSQALYWDKINKEQYIKDMKINSKGDIYYSAQGIRGIKRSTNYGISWEQILLPDYIGKIVINNSDFIFAAADFTNSIFRSTDNGNTWTEFNSSVFDFTCIHISSEGYLYAGNNTGIFLKSTDNGNSWKADSITGKEIKSIATTSNGQIFVGTYGDGMFTSWDYGNSWKEIVNDSLGLYIYSIVADKKDIIYVANDFNILISTNFGENWLLSEHFNSSQLVFAVDSSDNLYLGEYSVYKSTDSGKTWSNLGCTAYISSIEIYGQKIYAASSAGIFKYDPEIPSYVGYNYFPLNIGNSWQYKIHSTFIDVDSYTLRTDKIESDTLINFTRYYKYGNNWTRYSENDKKLYIWWNDSDRVHMDFNLFAGANFQQFLHGLYRTAKITEGTSNLFNKVIKYKGYSAGSYFQRDEGRYAENIGPFMNSYESTDGPDYYMNDYIIMSEIFDSTNARILFTNNFKLEISFIPIEKIDSNILDLSFNVDHPYSEFFPPNTPHGGVNFADSVYILFYYSGKDSLTEISKSDAVNIARTYSYSLSIKLNTELLKRGFIFNYKIVATDKGIIREETSMPDSGFYQCVWDETTDLAEPKFFVNEFSLSQNYPNPFNPTTKIKYTIANQQYVSLKIYDILGNEISTLVDEEKTAGEYEVEFSSAALANGVYFYTLKTGDFQSAGKMVVLK